MSSIDNPRGRAPSRAAIFRGFQRHALIPKPKAMSYAKLVGLDVSRRATKDELGLLAWIADNADALIVEGLTYALIRLPGDMIDRLAAIGAALADLEPDTDLDGGAWDGRDDGIESTLTEWTPDAPRQWSTDSGHDSDFSYPESIYQDHRFVDGGEVGPASEDAEDGGDVEMPQHG